jgi:hypothetical protein
MTVINETVTGNDSVAITGTASAGERTLGVKGIGDSTGVRGEGKAWNGVEGISQSTIGGAGVFGANDTGAGVRGQTKAQFNPGVHGIHIETEGPGIQGEADNGAGTIGISKTWIGVYGETNAPASAGASAVLGEGKDGGDGVKGHASGPGKAGVAGFQLANNGPGVFGSSAQGSGVHGRGPTGGFFEGGSVAGVHAVALGNCPAIMAKGNVTGGNRAGFFDGDVEVTGDIRLANADCAEDFDIAEAESIEPGTVMVLGEEGMLHQSQQAYDKRVAGVVSGAGGYKPALILDKQQLQSNRKPVALLGKAYCKVDAQYASIEIGDLLTTSPLPGHAMKADDPFKAFGAVIGKALRPLKEGRDLIPILIALQ